MRHRQVRDYRPFTGEAVHRLPDGRHLVMNFKGPAKVIDLEGNEMAPSPSEVIALLALARLSPGKKGSQKGLHNLRNDGDDWRLAG